MKQTTGVSSEKYTQNAHWQEYNEHKLHSILSSEANYHSV